MSVPSHFNGALHIECPCDAICVREEIGPENRNNHVAQAIATDSFSKDANQLEYIWRKVHQRKNVCFVEQSFALIPCQYHCRGVIDSLASLSTQSLNQFADSMSKAEALNVGIVSIYRALEDKTRPAIERTLSNQRAKEEHGHAEMTRL
jgi:hypothetical protein